MATSSAIGVNVTTSSVISARLPTLVICPLSVLSAWQDQIDAHIQPGSLKVWGEYDDVVCDMGEYDDAVCDTGECDDVVL